MMKTVFSPSVAAHHAKHRSATTSSSYNSASVSSNSSTSSTASSTTTPPSTPLPLHYWNPLQQQQQQQQQQQLLLLQEETPKISNNSKRRLSATGSTCTATSSCSPGAMMLDRSESASSLDCQSLQRSLKRVRLSSSPGELRLQLDLRNLVLSQNWVQIAEEIWHCPTTACRLEQCQVDPLRLIFYIPIQQSNNCPHPHGAATTTTRVWLQIPRMYPHRPPAVTRIHHAPSSPNQHIQAVCISIDAPDDNMYFNDCSVVCGVDGGCLPQATSVALPPSLAGSNSVLYFRQWTCILRLIDILNFLRQALGGSVGGVGGGGAVTTDNRANATVTSSTNHATTTPTCLWETAPMMPEASASLTGRFWNPFPPNRFDLGFDKGNPNAMDMKD